MYLQEVFDDLSFGEFANMAISNSKTGTLTAEKYPRIVSLINTALLDLYTRFPLKTKEFDLYQREGVSVYYLRSAHVGDPMGGDPDIYIDGTVADPINEDIIKLISAFNPDGYELGINKFGIDNITQLEQDVLESVPEEGNPIIISIKYQASYPKIVMSDIFDPKTYALTFPSYLKVPLLFHVAARFFTGKDSQAIEGQPNLATTFLLRYENECKRLEQNSLDLRKDDESEQFNNNGWV